MANSNLSPVPPTFAHILDNAAIPGADNGSHYNIKTSNINAIYILAISKSLTVIQPAS